MTGAKNWRRVAIGTGAGMFLCMALGRFSYGAMIPALVNTGGLDTVTAGYIGGANMIGFLAGAALSTFAAQTFRTDRLLHAVLIIAIAGLIGSAASFGPVWLGACRATIGFSTGCVMVLGTALTAQAAPPEHRTTAMSYIFIGVGIGILFGATIVPASLQFSILTAWLTVAVCGLLAGLLAMWCWRDIGNTGAPPVIIEDAIPPRNKAAWYAVIAASLCFSVGIVPHTIYWFDYLASDLGLGYSIASWHWTGVGVCAILGPIAAARLARNTTTSFATALTYFVMAFGVALPWFANVAPSLILSTIIFGAQPAVSTLLGARARDLGRASEMPAMMRSIILANGLGSAAAGVAIPMLLAETQSYEVLFLVGGFALLLGGLLCVPALLLSNPPQRA